MALNLLNDKDFNNYLTDITYQGGHVPNQQNLHGEFESVDYVAQHRDEIVKGILNQYIKLRVREYLLNQTNEPAFVKVDRNRTDLPGWTARVFDAGEDVYEFHGAQMSERLRDDITMVRDFLYDVAGQYVDKVINRARETDKKPKINYAFLKTTNEYDTFDKALEAANKWHENMAEELAKRNKNKEFLAKSLIGAEHIMDLGGGLSVYELTTPGALDFESENMGHCVGKGAYDRGVAKGKIKIYSIRDAGGEPHATLEVRKNEAYQLKGKANKMPKKPYALAAREFVEKQHLNITHDKSHFGFISIDGEDYDLFNLPKKMVVRRDLDVSRCDLDELPDFSEWEVQGDFLCCGNQLTSLNGAPKEVGGDFNCSYNQLTSLNGAPQRVGESFYCDENQLTSLNGAPKEVGRNFNCSDNQLTSLNGAPKEVGGDFVCMKNQLTSLAGAPKEVGGYFVCAHNQLTSLSGAPKEVGGGFNCSHNQLTSLAGAPKEVGECFDCSHNHLTSLEGAPQSEDGDFLCDENQLTSLSGAPKEVGGDFNCSDNQLTSLAGVPQSVGRDFYCSGNQLTSLAGAPQSVGRDFYCDENQLTSLNGAPKEVGGDFYCSENRLTSLNGAPQRVGGHFDCSQNHLTSLNGAPEKVGGYFDCLHNQLTSLNGAPKEVGGTFNCSDNQLTSLAGVPQSVGRDFYCSGNRLTSLAGAPQSVGRDFYCDENQLTSLNGVPKEIGGKFISDSHVIDGTSLKKLLFQLGIENVEKLHPDFPIQKESHEND